MGVRFECPAGHKLHVKAHLAGQRGICPECGVRFIVPSFSGGRVAEAGAGGDASGSNRFVSVDLESSASFAAGLDQAALGGGAPASANGGSIAWFVRPASGGQFGPVDAAAFQQWVTEGRVAADSWVWRTGWTDWKSGGEALRMIASDAGRRTPPPTPTAHRVASARRSATPEFARVVPAAESAFDLSDEETDDLLAIPQNGAAIDLAATHVPPARAVLQRRRKANQRLTLALAGLTLVMIVAAIIVFATRGDGEAEADGEGGRTVEIAAPTEAAAPTSDASPGAGESLDGATEVAEGDET